MKSSRQRTAELAESLSAEGACPGHERVAGPSASYCRPPRISCLDRFSRVVCRGMALLVVDSVLVGSVPVEPPSSPALAGDLDQACCQLSAVRARPPGAARGVLHLCIYSLYYII